MAARFTPVDTIEKLDSLIAESSFRPIFLFKHSNSCGISAHLRYMISSLDAEVYEIVVQESRLVSNAVAERLETRHASPQAFVISGGKPIYHATHYGIDPDAIQKILESSETSKI
jgi:bacillithiol system protein YtxJ